MGFGKTFFACLLAVAVGSVVSFFLTIFVLVGIISSISFFAKEAYVIENSATLMIDLSEPIVESQSSSFIDSFDFDKFAIKESTTIYEAVALIDAAAIDPRIKGIYIKVTPAIGSSLSSLYELRQAIVRFNENASEKFVVAYGDVYSQAALYLASAADKVYLNPAGGVDWCGMALTSMFFKGALDKLGVEPEIIRHGKFKGAVEPFMLTKMSDENRLQNKQLVESLWNFVVGEIATSRNLSADTLQYMASNLSIATSKDAMRAGLVDSVIYRDQLTANLARLMGRDEPALITLAQYKRSGVSINGDVMSDNKVAVIYASGEIVDMGNSQTQIVGNDLANTIRKARIDKNVKAVVLRVNSPGGSALASEVIRREVELTRAAKPVVVSMGDYAASGGYWISSPADQIVTTPTTITGSIGVFGLMFNVEKGAREKLGVTFDVVSTNPSADIGSIFRSLTTAERAVIQNSVDTIYNNFVQYVAKGRNMTTQAVDSLGEGRVWSGLQASKNGLANTIGGLNDAIIIAAEQAGIQKYRISTIKNDNSNSFVDIFSSLSRATLSSIFGKTADKVIQADAEIQALLTEQGVRAMMEQKIKVEF